MSLNGTLLLVVTNFFISLPIVMALVTGFATLVRPTSGVIKRFLEMRKYATMMALGCSVLAELTMLNENVRDPRIIIIPLKFMLYLVAAYPMVFWMTKLGRRAK